MKIMKAHAAVDYKDPTRNARLQIKQALAILSKFNTEEGFDEYVDQDTIAISVGFGNSVSFQFCPETWDVIEEALKRNVCFLIQSNELDAFPYYKKIFDSFAADLDTDDFVY